LKEEVSGAAGH